jgi:hypothetical protein
LGLLIEEARTNSIRNSQAGGSTNGVIGSGGVMPTNWTLGGSLGAHGITGEVIGTGTEDGLSYLDVKVSGTPTASSTVGINAEQVFHIVASNGQTWTNSAYLRLVGGSTTNASVRVYMAGRVAGGSIVAGETGETTASVTTAALRSQRYSTTFTMSSASVERVSPQFLIYYTNGNPIDITLRIAAPQLEQGAFPTSYIPTTSASATRAADSAVVTPISSFYNQAEGTLFAEWSSFKPTTAGGSQIAFEFGDGTTNNRTRIARLETTGFPSFQVTSAGTNVAVLSATSALPVGVVGRVIGTYKADDFASYWNGTLVDTDSSGAVPSSLTTARIGLATFTPTGNANGHIRKVAYWPRRLSTTLLQQLTT